VGFLIAAMLAAIPSAAASDTERQGTPPPDPGNALVPMAVGEIEDGGFEAGTPNPYWGEASGAFGTPLCTVAACGMGGGTGPHSGDWWVWFGGVVEEEAGAVYQEFVIPSGSALLSFYLEIPVALVSSLFQASIDGDVVFEVTSVDQATYSTYTEVTVDISAYADGGLHGLGFAGAKVAGGSVNFFLDDVSIETSEDRQPPVAVNDTASVANGGTVKIDVLSNDANPEGEALEIIKTSGPVHGAAIWSVAEGRFIYTHDGSNTTSDSFTYKLADTVLESAPATVSIAIAAKPAVAPTVGLQDPTTGQWHLRDASGAVTTFFYGNPGDVPFVGDWDGNGVETPGLYRQSDGYVYLRNSNTQGVADVKFFFGNPGDVPIAGDFNNDGFDTVSIYRPSNQTFYIINKLGSGDQGLGAAESSYVFGNPGDKPFVGDFDGDGVETTGLHRESTGLVYFRNSHTQGNADAQFIFGDPDDRLVAGDWNANGTFSPALFRPSSTTMYFRYTNTQGNADSSFVWGRSGFMPVAGTFGELPGGGGIEPPPPPPPGTPPGTPPIDGTFTGPVKVQPGLSGGDVSFEVSAAGTKVSNPMLHLVLINFKCGGAAIGPSFDYTLGLNTTVPVAGSSFTVTGSPAWQGTFDSATSASGTISGQISFPQATCPWGPFSWTATAN
jgi:hypothetical protein